MLGRMLIFLRAPKPLLLCGLLLSAIFAHAQVFRTPDPGTGSVEVGGKWQFHTGDNPGWANPAYNDSGWEQLNGDTTWGAQSHPGYTGFAWYRKRVEVTGTGSTLAILIPPVDDAYEIYWNGRKIGSYGSLPPHAAWWAVGHSAVYPLGTVPLSGVIALRVWKSTLSSFDLANLGGLNATPALGNPSVLAMQSTAHRFRQDYRQLPQLLIGAVVLVAGLLALVLFLRERDQWLYLWLSIYLLAEGVLAFRVLDAVTYGLHFTFLQLYVQLAGSLSDISLWLLLLTLFGFSRERRWRRWTVLLAALYLTAQTVDISTIFFWQHGGPALQWIDAISTAIYVLTPFYILFIVGFGLLGRKHRELWPLAISIFLYGLWSPVFQLSAQGRRFTHWTIADHMRAWSLQLGSYRFGATFLLDTLLFLVLLFTVARQQLLQRRRQAQVEMEIKSAREVQQVLVPEQVPAIPGLAVASIYKPATELGGDFYQVIPLGESGALVVVGDVSGKGLRAAMVVSLIVGTLRTLAEYTREPAEILRGLNHRLLGRTQGGFATCLILRIAANGDAVIANAGHLAPYRNGVELPVGGSLPLGIVPEAEYDELAFHLRESETLIFYTDGIVEARNQQGQLFGFNRLQALSESGSSAAKIAEVASKFGQEDDITVLTLTRLGADLPAHASAVSLTTQIATL